MIYGIGSDIVNIKRINHILKEHGDSFAKRILNQHEQIQYKNHINNKNCAHYVAKRFAAKEAFAKALGTGIGKVVNFGDLTIYNNKLGKPYFQFSKKLGKYLGQNNINKVHLSLADEKTSAVAFVVLEKD